MIESFPTAFANSLWQGALLSLAVWFVLRHLTRFSAATRLAIWQVTLAVVLLLPALRQLPAIPLFEAPPVARVAPSASSPIAASEEPLTVPVHRPLIEVDNHGPAELFAPLAAILALLQLLRLAIAYAVLTRWKRKSHPAPIILPAPLSRSVAVRLSSRIGMPMALGYVRPAILLPDSFAASLTPDQLRLVLLHESAHLERRDDWTTLCERLLRAVFFIHPAVYFIGRQLDREREMACDDWVVAHSGSTKPYAEALARVAELTSLSHAPLLAAGAGRRKEIFARLEALLDSARNRMPAASTPLVLGAGFLLLLAVSQSTPYSHLFGFGSYNTSSVISNGQNRREFKIRGEIDFTDDDQDVASMSPGAKLVIAVGDRWSSRQVEIEANDHGDMTRLYFSSGVRRTYDAEAQRLLARELSSWLRERETNLASRLNRWVKTGGIEGALREIRTVGNGHVKRLYLEELLTLSTLAEEHLRRVLKVAAELDSDSEKRHFFDNAARHFRTPALEVPLLAFVDSLHSDGDRRHILSQLASDLPSSSLPRLLRSVSHLSSDDDKTKLLLEILATHPPTPELFQAANTIHSDGDRRRLLSAILTDSRVDPATVSLALDSAALLTSDGDKATLLLNAAPSVRNYDAPVKVLATMHSDSDRTRAILELLGPSAASQAALLPQAARINSDGDKARILTRVAELFADEAAVREPYFATLNSIHSAGDRQRALLALLSRIALTPETLAAIERSATQIHDDGDRHRVQAAITARR